MGNHNASRVLSVRVNEDLLKVLRRRAANDGRSLSGEVVSILKAEFEKEPMTSGKPLPLTGWLSHLDAPETLAEFQAVRRAASAKVLTGIRGAVRRPAASTGR